MNVPFALEKNAYCEIPGCRSKKAVCSVCNVLQIVYILSDFFCLVVPSIAKIEILKSLAIIVDWSGFPFNFVCFRLTYIETLSLSTWSVNIAYISDDIFPFIIENRSSLSLRSARISNSVVTDNKTAIIAFF